MILSFAALAGSDNTNIQATEGLQRCLRFIFWCEILRSRSHQIGGRNYTVCRNAIFSIHPVTREKALCLPSNHTPIAKFHFYEENKQNKMKKKHTLLFHSARTRR